MPQIYSHGRPSVRSGKAIVTSAHPSASMAGAEMLRRGGNAFDAIVATAAALNVVEPFMSGLAGLGTATLYPAAAGAVQILDFHPPVAQNFDASELTRAETDAGPNASGVPGNLAGWCRIAADHGTLPLKTLFAPAIALARDGYPLSPFFQAMVAACNSRTMQPEWQQTYIDTSNNASLGALLRQPALADTLAAIAETGPGYLYGGPLGRKMSDHLQSLGGCIDLADLESVEANYEEPIVARFHNLDVHVAAPPAEAFQFPLTLRILDGAGLENAPHLSIEHLDKTFRSIRLAAEIRIQNNQCSRAHLETLFDDAHVASLQARVNDGRPIHGRTEQFADGPLQQKEDGRGHTTSFSCVDAAGNAVCITQSLGSPFGSGVVIPGTGVCMNNFMNWGDLHPVSPNYLQGGKPMSMCLAPSISLKNGEPVLVLGTPGSYGILQTQAQAFVHHLVYGLDLQAAIDAPRARLWDGYRVDLESRIEETVVTDLRSRGHDIQMITPFSMSCGGMQAIARDPETGALTGAADSRRDGAAIPVI